MAVTLVVGMIMITMTMVVVAFMIMVIVAVFVVTVFIVAMVAVIVPMIMTIDNRAACDFGIDPDTTRSVGKNKLVAA